MAQISETLFNRLVVLALVVGFLAVGAMGGTALWVMQRNAEFTALVNHTYQVQREVSDLRIRVETAEAARRGYLLTHDEATLQTFQDNLAAATPNLERIAGLTVDNPAQRERMMRLRPLLAEDVAALSKSIAIAETGDRNAAIDAFQTDGSTQVTRRLRALLQDMLDEEGRLLTLRNSGQEGTQRVLLGVLAAAGVLILLVAVGSVWVIAQYTRELTRSRNDLRKLNENLEAAVDERTTDLRRANDEIQRFAYIVSHDLRSPLVNVMGFTAELDATVKPLTELIERVEATAPQLVTDDDRSAVRTDLPEAIGFIRTSTQKMDRLINAILRLSREGRRVLTAERLNMAGLLGNVAAAMRHRTEQIGAVIEIDPRLPDLVADRVAIEQIFSNLIENAVKYLKAGRPGVIRVRGASGGGRVVYEIQDNGRGIDPKDHDRIFDLFRRAGAQDQPGEGIGLAHVRALVHRLGGLIVCESALDQGATFRVSLPSVALVE